MATVDAYAAPRCVAVDGVSEAVLPVLGLAPGCPAATHWLALPVHDLRGAVAEAAPELSVGDCVDNMVMVAAGAGVDVVVAMDVGRAVAVRLSEDVGTPLASRPAQSARTVAADLVSRPRGQPAGRRSAGALGAVRAGAAKVRLLRCAWLPLPWWHEATSVPAARPAPASGLVGRGGPPRRAPVGGARRCPMGS